jgi:hypothetical protein
MKMVPAIWKAKAEHEEFAALKTAKRLDFKTNRADFMSHVSTSPLIQEHD